MARATLTIGSKEGIVRSRLVSGALPAIYEHSASLEKTFEIASTWRGRSFVNPISPQEQVEIGRSLAITILGPDINQALVGVSQPRDKHSLTLGLELTDPLVESLPWELLWCEDVQRHLGLTPGTFIYRAIGDQPAPDTPPDKVRLLIVYANPDSAQFPRLPHLNNEVLDLRGVCEKADAKIDVARLGDAGPWTLRRELGVGAPPGEKRGYDVVHFCGHAIRTIDGGQLILQGGRSHEALDATELAEWLVETGVRFAFLSACDTAGRPESVAETLVRKGVPAAIGMQTPVRDENQTHLVCEFYRELVKGRSVDEALALARGSRRHDSHWWAPVLCAAPGRHLLVTPPLDADLPPTNLPEYASAFVGREAELLRLSNSLLKTVEKIITIIGLGGSGKSRLAVELGQRMRRRVDGHGALFPQGVRLVDCTDVTDPNQLYATVAASLDLQLGDGDSALALQTLLAKTRVLVILDGVDGLVNGGHSTALEGLPQKHGARFVATSRRALGVPGEEVFELGPMQLAENPSTDEGVKLFLSTSQLGTARPLGTHALKTVGNICRMLGGLALAIQIVAARARVLPLEDVHAYVQANPAASVTDVLFQSISLLDPPDRALLERLTTFHGSFAIEDITEVLGVERFELADRLFRLGQHSMILQFQVEGKHRYRLLDLVREALVRHTEQDLQPDRERFANVFAERARGHRETERGLRKNVSESLWAELPNIQAAFATSIAADSDENVCSISDALLLPLFESGMWDELEAVTQAGVVSADRIGNTALPVRILGIRGALAARRGNRDECHSIWEERLQLSRQVGNAEGEADTLIDFGCQHVQDGLPDQALALFAEAELALERCDRPDMRATVATMRARIALDQEDPTRAQGFLNIAEEIAAAAPEKDPLMFVHINIAGLFKRLCEWNLAKIHCQHVLRYALDASRKFHVQRALIDLGEVHLATQDNEAAARCFIAAENLSQVIMSRHTVRLQRNLEEVKNCLPTGIFGALQAECANLKWDDLARHACPEE